MSFMLAWFRLKSDSLWPAVLFHASHNVFFPIVFDNLTRNTGHTLMYTTVFGAFPACTTGLFALYFWSRREEIGQASNNARARLSSIAPVAPARAKHAQPTVPPQLEIQKAFVSSVRPLR
jgi:hypothetical protein